MPCHPRTTSWLSVAKDTIYLKVDRWNVSSQTLQELVQLQSKQQKRDQGRKKGNTSQSGAADALALERIEIYEKHRARNRTKKNALIDCLAISGLSASKIYKAHDRLSRTPFR
jgi:hypothetical protein